MRRRAVLLLGLALCVLLPASLWIGSTGLLRAEIVVDALGGLLGLGRGVDPSLQAIVELRLWRSLTAVAVGASLALSGALLQGLFRNPLATPSILGVSGAASLGAILAMIVLAGMAPSLLVDVARDARAWWIPVVAFVFAIGSTGLVWLLGATFGGTSSASLLLAGIGLATLWSALSAAIQSLVLHDWEVALAIVSWTFGNLEARGAWHAALSGGALLVALASLPWITRELDLLAFGEDDARGLGVATRRVQLVVVLVSSLLVACTVAVAGQIAFLGLVAPNLVRLLVGPRHRAVLPASVFAGALLLLIADLLDRISPQDLRPGVLLSLLGAPVFLVLVARGRRELATW